MAKFRISGTKCEPRQKTYYNPINVDVKKDGAISFSVDEPANEEFIYLYPDQVYKLIRILKRTHKEMVKNV